MPSPRLLPRLRRRSKVRDVTQSLPSSWRLFHHAHFYHRPDLRLSHILFSNHRRLLRTGQEGINPRQTRKSSRTNKDFSCRAPRLPAVPWPIEKRPRRHCKSPECWSTYSPFWIVPMSFWKKTPHCVHWHHFSPAFSKQPTTVQSS